MVIMNFERHELKALSFRSTIESGGKAKIKKGFAFNVDYTKDGTRGVAKLRYKIMEEAEKPRLELEIVLYGYFTCGGIKDEQDKKHAHLQAYNYMFSHALTIITTVTAVGGLNPLTTSKPAMDWDEIVIKSAGDDPFARGANADEQASAVETEDDP